MALMMLLSIIVLSSQQAVAANYHLNRPTNTQLESLVSVAKLDMVDDENVEKTIANVKVFYNPIAEQVTVTFKLNKQNVVSIKVMDALGNEVLNLTNSRMDEGMQNLSFDTNSKLTTGFYFVRVTSGTETVVKRISVR